MTRPIELNPKAGTGPVTKQGRIGIIGYRNHARRLIELLQAHPAADLRLIYHPDKDLAPLKFTNDLTELMDLDAILIASPTSTHAHYLQYLIKHYKGYIFCEKPLVNTQEDLAALHGTPPAVRERVFVNYNFRYSRIAEIFDEVLNHPAYGDPVHIAMNCTFGLAFKEGYADNWRADGQKNLHAITETGSVHYVDLLNLTMGECKRCTYAPRNIALTGTSYDTSTLFLEYEKATATIVSSYAAPYNEEIQIILTNAAVTIRDGQIKICSPRDTFDKEGLFATPPVVKEDRVTFSEIYHASLQTSVDCFLDYVMQNKSVPQHLFAASLRTNDLILKLQSE